MAGEQQPEYNPLLQVFDGDQHAQDHLRFQRWMEEQHPTEDHTPDPQGVVGWQQFLRREKLKELMRG